MEGSPPSRVVCLVYINDAYGHAFHYSTNPPREEQDASPPIHPFPSPPPLFRPLTAVLFFLSLSLSVSPTRCKTHAPRLPGTQLIPAEVVCAEVLGLWQ